MERAAAEVLREGSKGSDPRRVSDSVAERISFIGSSTAGVLGVPPNGALAPLPLLAKEPASECGITPNILAPLPRSGKDGGKTKEKKF